jgi:arylsulfatase A-like enzyme
MPDSDAPAAKSGKPNIVVIMADDINWSNKHVKYEEN